MQNGDMFTNEEGYLLHVPIIVIICLWKYQTLEY